MDRGCAECRLRYTSIDDALVTRSTRIRVRQRLRDREDEKDSKRAHVVLSQGHEVVGPSYSMMSSAAAMWRDKGRH
jgi:hypothetical protein